MKKNNKKGIQMSNFVIISYLDLLEERAPIKTTYTAKELKSRETSKFQFLGSLFR